MIFRGAGRRDRHAEDSRIIQETYQGLSRLEERIEALETILHDRKREDHGK
jgi:phage shock protein B